MFPSLVAALPGEFEFHSIVYLEHSLESTEEESAVRSVVDPRYLAHFSLAERFHVEEQHTPPSHFIVRINLQSIPFPHRLFQESFMFAFIS